MRTGQYLLVTAVLVFALLVAFLQGEKRGYSKAGEAYLWQLDTLEKICNEVPDTVTKRDTVYIKVLHLDTVYTPIVSAVSNDINYYRDTVRTKDLEFIIADKVRGSILTRRTKYTLNTPHIIDTVQIYKTVPRFIDKPVLIQNKAYLRASVSVGYYSVGYGKIFNSRHAVGLDAVLFDNRPYLTIGYTYLIQ